MESPADYLDSPTEGDDIAYPCKGCGDILEEGKAFELAGNRWHLNCFRCNTCGTLLDSDANLLLLGDGSLICNNCTYSCSACGNKIEDLAILTGDQAFCATCFRCRNCKRKIENLRYARTSQGIFCMTCHESLMARRRKKSRAAAANKAKEKEQQQQQQQQQTMLIDKSLPALPPNAIPQSAFSSDRDTPGSIDTDTPTELSPRPRTNYPESSSRSSSRRPQSPERSGEVRDGLLPSTTYRNHRHSHISQASEGNGDGDFFIPLALDPSPAPINNAVTPQSVAESYNEAIKPNSKTEKDYFGISKSSGRQTQQVPAHIAFQEKGRQLSSDFTESPSDSSRKGSLSTNNKSTRDDTRLQHANKGSPRGHSPGEQFRLQEVPKSKKSTRSDSQSDLASPTGELSAPPRSQQRSESNRNLATADQDSRPSMDSAASSQAKGESGNNSIKSPITRKEVPSATMKSSMDLSSGENTSVSSASSTDIPGVTPNLNGKSISGPLVHSSTSDELVPPSRALARPPAPQQKLSDSYMAPRAPPAPPTGNESDDKLPRWSAGGDFTMDEDMARILGGTDEGSQSILRRVSNAVRHGRTSSEQSVRGAGGHSRSMSETTRTTISPKTWQKIQEDGNPQVDISSPISIASPVSGSDPALLRRQLRNSEQRVAELERQIGADGDIQNLNKKLIEKRKTVSVLDSQAEIIIRQIETLAGYVEKAKTSKGNVNFAELEESAIKDFVEKLEKLKQSLSVGIEALYEERNGLLEEKTAACADRDRALMEFEQLSSKNAQLAEMNNDLTHQIQERFKAQSGTLESPRPPMNGLGIYTHSKERSNASIHLDDASLRPSTGTTYLNSAGYPHSMDQDAPMGEAATVLAAPHVINIRKGQAKKFNWKKGGQSVAKGVTKGFKGAFGAVNAQPQNQWGGQFGDNIGMPYNMTAAPSEFPSAVGSSNNSLPRSVSNDPRQAGGFGLFGKKGGQMPKSQSNGNILAQAGAEHASVLFGSDLVERADHERRQIPSVVTRCIEEVELRGMDVEGIYRKTGGTGQVNSIKEGFEKTEDYDISDPDLDITAVTSVLKQYFRKLPTPLLTFDIYDRVLESTFVEDEEERCVHLRQTFNSLPPKHRDCLEFLIFHLARVASREKENLMTPKNLAVVFAPTIMRDTSLEREMTDMHAKNIAVQFVIENSNEIFGGA